MNVILKGTSNKNNHFSWSSKNLERELFWYLHMQLSFWLKPLFASMYQYILNVGRCGPDKEHT